jgi:hypothetical protein
MIDKFCKPFVEFDKSIVELENNIALHLFFKFNFQINSRANWGQIKTDIAILGLNKFALYDFAYLHRCIR